MTLLEIQHETEMEADEKFLLTYKSEIHGGYLVGNEKVADFKSFLLTSVQKAYEEGYKEGEKDNVPAGAVIRAIDNAKKERDEGWVKAVEDSMIDMNHPRNFMVGIINEDMAVTDFPKVLNGILTHLLDIMKKKV